MFSKIAINWRGGYHVIPTPCSDTQLRLDISDEFRRCLEALGEPKLSFCGKPWANMAPTRWLWKLIHIFDLQIHMYT